MVYQQVRSIDGLPLLLLDAGIIVVAYLLGLFGGFEGTIPTGELGEVLWLSLAVPLTLHLLVNRAVGLYGPVWRFASVEEAARIVVAVILGSVLSMLALGVIARTTDTTLPSISAAGLAGLTILLGCGGVRFQARLFSVEREGLRRNAHGIPTLVVGAGDLGVTLTTELDADDRVHVVGFVDDDPALRRRSIRGRRILGSTDDLEALCEEYRIERIVVAIADESRDDLRPILARAMRTDAQVQVLPPSSERANLPLVGTVRDLDLDDLLARDHAPIDLDEVSDWLEGATVMVTGAGGSIGSEVARQVHQFNPRTLLLVDRDETLLHQLVTTDAPDGVQILADIRDDRRMSRLFEKHRPDVVFHAAALKHVPILESMPIEAIRTNVLATARLATIAAESGCRRFVAISTDKAANPCSVMGATKRAAELAVQAVGHKYDVPFVNVRFGNVLGSRGSVVPTFLQQILAGGPVTITDPKMTRYFMTVTEAVSLVLQAGYQAREGRTFVLDMGEPVPIMNLAHHLIRLAGLRPELDIPIEVTGRRPGERMHEQLLDEAESTSPSRHPSIRNLQARVATDHVEVAELLDDLKDVCERGSDAAAIRILEQFLCRSGVPCTLRPQGDLLDLTRYDKSGDHPRAGRRPAILGGPRAFADTLPFARPARPPLSAVVERLTDSYDRGMLTNGPLVRELEERAADYLGVRHVVAVSSCTTGLMLTVQALTEGREGGVVMPSFTFTASAHSVMWNQRMPIFAECDRASFQLDLLDAAARSDRAAMVLATHVAGGPCKPELVEAMAREQGMAVAFDAAHAFGSERKGRRIGGYGDAEVFSLTPTKVLVAGEGGLIATNRDDLSERLRADRDYGNTGDYDPRTVGLNGRMSEFHAATALASLDLLDETLARRRLLAKRYIDGLADVSGVHVQSVDPDDLSTYKDLSITVEADLGLTRNQLLAVLAAEGIETRCYFSPPVHRQKAYAGLPLSHLPATDDVSSRVVSLPIYPDMTEDDVDRVVEVLWTAQVHADELNAATFEAQSRRHHPAARRLAAVGDARGMSDEPR